MSVEGGVETRPRPCRFRYRVNRRARFVRSRGGVRSVPSSRGPESRLACGRSNDVGKVLLMDIELRSSAEADQVVVRCSNRRLGQALADLYFFPEGDHYAKSFPSGSVTDAILAHFRDALMPLLRQTARLDMVPWRRALHDTVRRLDEHDIDWWLVGSTALAVRGLPVEPRDIDLVIAEPDVMRAATAFADVLVEPTVETDEWISRWFGRAWLDARVEWLAGVSEKVDNPYPADFGPTAAAALSHIRWEGVALRVPPIELQRDVSARRGLLDRVAMIDALADIQPF